ncbi:putative aminopeptidase [Dyadobacter jejuensis]|uniref:Putative aminopeptidase n=1 Tax=Dyadobacter jejuensis TaxID=1082580 RepID=A0A316AN35_9BACT|nr:aminopeptidase [Dyadobacter jejuensis]PWJ58524.1 putative aminopeptidase [Dyadobacter jejuensis]
MKKAFLVLGVLLIGSGLYYRELLSYGYMQAKGQLDIIWNVVPVEEVLQDPSFPDSLKAQIRLIEEIKQFGVDSLGLTPSDNYTTFYDQKGKPLIWLVTASEKYRIKAYKWHFPIIGSFPYKGYFDSTRAVSDELVLKNKGYDTDIGEVSAWSTLGYLKDPILSSMLTKSEGSLANLILHELTHGTLFVKSNLELNENLASFIGNYGAERFLIFKYGPDSKELKNYRFSKNYNEAYAQHMLRGSQILDSLYDSFETQKYSEITKDSLKHSAIAAIVSNIDTLLNGKMALYSRKNNETRELPNNAVFISYKTYRSQQKIFKKEFEEKYDSNFKTYLNQLKSIHDSP